MAEWTEELEKALNSLEEVIIRLEGERNVKIDVHQCYVSEPNGHRLRATVTEK